MQAYSWLRYEEFLRCYWNHLAVFPRVKATPSCMFKKIPRFYSSDALSWVTNWLLLSLTMSRWGVSHLWIKHVVWATGMQNVQDGVSQEPRLGNNVLRHKAKENTHGEVIQMDMQCHVMSHSVDIKCPSDPPLHSESPPQSTQSAKPLTEPQSHSASLQGHSPKHTT